MLNLSFFNPDCDWRGSDHRPDVSGDRRRQGDADADRRMSHPGRDHLLEHDRRPQQNRHLSSRGQRKGDRKGKKDSPVKIKMICFSFE